MSGNIYSSHKKGRVSPEGLLLSQARGGVGGAGGREEPAEVSSPSQRKFPESRARMGSNSILPPAGEAAAGRCDEEVRASRRTRCEGHMGGVGDFKSLSLQSFLQAHVDSTVVTAYILTGALMSPCGVPKEPGLPPPLPQSCEPWVPSRISLRGTAVSDTLSCLVLFILVLRPQSAVHTSV